MFKLVYKLDELSQWRDFGEEFNSVEDAIESSGELLYDGYIVKIEEVEA